MTISINLTKAIHWFKYKVLAQFFLWYGTYIMQYNRVVLHLSENKQWVIGITFGDTKEKQK